VGAAAEGEVAAGFAVYVEAVGVVEVAFVAVGGGQHHEQRASRGDELFLVVDVVGGDVAGDVWSGWFVAQEFFDGAGYECGVGGEFFALVGVFG